MTSVTKINDPLNRIYDKPIESACPVEKVAKIVNDQFIQSDPLKNELYKLPAHEWKGEKRIQRINALAKEASQEMGLQQRDPAYCMDYIFKMSFAKGRRNQIGGEQTIFDQQTIFRLSTFFHENKSEFVKLQEFAIINPTEFNEKVNKLGDHLKSFITFFVEHIDPLNEIGIHDDDL